MKRTLSRVAVPVVVVACVAGLAGCASGDPDPTPTVTVTETVTATPEPEPTPEETEAAEDGPLAMGATAEFDGWTATVHAFDPDPAPEAPAPGATGTKWAAADIEVCNPDDENATVSANPWRLVDAQNRLFTPSSTTYSQFPEPNYGLADMPIAPGECIRGWVTFTVREDAQLVTVRYQAMDQAPILWAIG